jgi:hypothetical protein
MKAVHSSKSSYLSTKPQWGPNKWPTLHGTFYKNEGDVLAMSHAVIINAYFVPTLLPDKGLHLVSYFSQVNIFDLRTVRYKMEQHIVLVKTFLLKKSCKLCVHKFQQHYPEAMWPSKAVFWNCLTSSEKQVPFLIKINDARSMLSQNRDSRTSEWE